MNNIKFQNVLRDEQKHTGQSWVRMCSTVKGGEKTAQKAFRERVKQKDMAERYLWVMNWIWLSNVYGLALNWERYKVQSHCQLVLRVLPQDQCMTLPFVHHSKVPTWGEERLCVSVQRGCSVLTVPAQQGAFHNPPVQWHTIPYFAKRAMQTFCPWGRVCRMLH